MITEALPVSHFETRETRGGRRLSDVFFFFSLPATFKKKKKHVIPNDLPKIRDLTPAACSNNPTVAISLARSNVRRKNKKHGPPPPGPAAALPLHSTADGSEKQNNAGETLAGRATEVCPEIRAAHRPVVCVQRWMDGTDLIKTNKRKVKR